MQYDGSIRINTELNTENASAQLMSLENRIVKTADKIASVRAKGAEVIGMDIEAGRVSAGACELVELETKDESIIFILDIFSIGVAIESG